MENFMNDLRRNGDDLTTASSLRLASRPQIYEIFEDHGRTLVPGSQRNKGSHNTRQQVSGTQKFKPAGTTANGKATASTRLMGGSSTKTTAKVVNTQNKADIELSDSQSEDEIDMLASHTFKDDDSIILQKPLSQTRNDAHDGYLETNGEWHPYVEGFQPIAPVLSKLKFKKNKEKGKLSDTALSQPTSQQPSSPKNGSTLGSSSTSICETSSSKRDTVYVRHRPLSSKDPNSKPEGTSQASSVKPDSFKEMKFGPPSRSVRPRIKRSNPEGGKRQPNGLARETSADALDDDTFEGQRSARRRSRSLGLSRSRSRSRCSSPKATVRKLEAFPALSPPSSPALSKRRPENFPNLSPLAAAKSQDLLRRQKRQPFPMLSPSSELNESRGRALMKRIQGEGKKKEIGDALSFTQPDDGDDAGQIIMVSAINGKGKERALPVDSAKGKPKRKPKVFPMSSQMLQSIDSSPKIAARGKRLSKGSGDERIPKRSKKERDVFPQTPTRVFEEGDSLLFSPEVDPRALCPYCDTPLPENPTSLLLDLIVATKKKASSDPRPSNPLGLKAPVAVFVTVCQRHRFESQILPEAERKGWPKTIEWMKVANRVMKMKNVLQALIDDPGDSNMGERIEDDWEIPFSDKRTRKQKGPKANSIFWNEVIQEIKEKGSRVVAGVRGQFANFEKAQPGYYGEQGSVIIHQTLYDMFPPSSMDATLTAPLTGIEFTEKILVPEVALRLIMEDRGVNGEEGKQEALTVLRESSSYGVFMFPEDGGEWCGRRRKAKDNQLGVGDMIVMQRAMKRRKELEKEEEVEEEERRIQRNKEKIAPTKPKPRPLGKGASAMSIGSSQEFSRSLRPTNETRSDFEDTDPVSGVETAIEISESDSDGDRRDEPSSSQRSSMYSTNRAISGLNLSSDTDASSRAVVGARPMTRSRSRSVAPKPERNLSRMGVDGGFQDITKTPMPARQISGLKDEDTPQAPRAPQNRATPPLMKARRRQNKDSVAPFRIHLNRQAQSGNSQDSRWLLEDNDSS